MSAASRFAAALLALSLTSAAHGLGLPPGWEKAIVLIEAQCSASKMVSCAEFPLMPDGSTVGPAMPDGSSGCKAWCDLPAKECPVAGNLDYCKSPTDYFPDATGFLIQMCGGSRLVTNRHVLEPAAPRAIRVRSAAGAPVWLEIGAVRFPADANIDLAIASIRKPASGFKDLPLQVGIINEDALRAQGKTALAPMSDSRPGDDVVFAGFPASIRSVRRLFQDQETPLVRSGIVSLLLPGTHEIGDATVQDALLVDSWAFQGNSGSPVVLPPSLINYDSDDRDRKQAKIVGIISRLINLHAPIDKAVVVSGVATRVNAGLAIVQSLDSLEETIRRFPGAKCEPIATPAPTAP